MTVARRQLRWTVSVWGALMVVALWSTPARAAEFRIAVGVDPDTLDPVQLTTTTVGNMVDYMVETLTKLVPDGSIQPSLAESWSVSPDGLQYTFKLIQGVTFDVM
jgi:peptide/nickel transport system substrate-binding protein